MKKFFAVLGLDENSSYEEVKQARVKLLKKYHPDLYSGNLKYAKMKTEDINESFQKLKKFFEDNKKDENNQDESKNVDYIKISESKKSIDKRNYNTEDKNRVLDKLKKKNIFNCKNILDGSIIVLFCVIIILFFVLIFA